MKILLINSDLAINRGDRAIAQGLIDLARNTFPEAEITAISEHASRDSHWYGVRFLEQSIHSLNPIDFLRLWRAARHAELVLWGGGEFLKDYTNKLGLYYWTAKICAIAMTGTPIIGAFQGIGPTYGRISRRLAALVVSRTRCFVTRDEESRDKLIAWGVNPARVIASYDCAVYSGNVPANGISPAAVFAGLDEDFLQSFAVVAPRNWFHYRRGGLIPYRWRLSSPTPSPENARYRNRLAELVELLIRSHGRVLLVPMHMGEDPALCHALRESISDPDAVLVLEDDTLNPAELQGVIARARLMVAFRLHAGIIATSSGVPTITYYYVDKGRLFTEQMGASAYSRPIESLLEENAIRDFEDIRESLSKDLNLSETISDHLDTMRDAIRKAFLKALKT